MISGGPDGPFRGDIEGLRAVAVLSVTLFHFDFLIFEGGFVGVDIFFVISGYLITGKIIGDLRAGNFSFLEFYKARVRRILPASLITILVTVFFGAIIFPPTLFEELGKSAVWSLLFAANIFFSGAAGYFDPSALERPLLHYWSLAVEEQFYFVWPAVIVASVALFGLRRWPFVLIVVLVLLIGLSEAWISYDRNEAYYQSPPRFFEFLVGALILVFMPFAPKLPRAAVDVIFLLGLAGVAASVLLYSETLRFPGVLALPVTAATGALIFAGKESRFRVILANNGMRFVGRISYSLYLVHWPVVVYYKYVAGEELSPVEQGGLLLASVCLAWLLWYFVEVPFRRPGWKNQTVTSKRRPYAAIAALFCAAMIPSVAAYASGGMTWRLQSESVALHREVLDGNGVGSKCVTSGLPRGYDCAFGDVNRATPYLLLIGDSHSTRLRTPLWRMLDPIKEKGLARSINGCIPMLGGSVIHERNSKWFQSCTQRVSRALKFAVEDQDAKVVVLAARWSLYASNIRLGESASKGRLFLGTTADDERSNKRSETVFRYRMLGTVKRLVDAGKKVVLIGQVPNVGFDLQRCLLSPIGPFLPECEPRSREQVDSDLRFTNTVLNGIALKFPDQVLFVDPTDAFCNVTTCGHSSPEGQLLYVDNNHINRHGAARLFATALEKIAPFIRPVESATPVVFDETAKRL
ncbi:acyltransferase family protein [Mesorhizobium sp. WSM2239]|uniref:Acyltransferase family protein n=2 Tax=unclassified Mesorhizobium TaxID=325217 RepID=A0AAU8DCM2_9HYPH